MKKKLITIPALLMLPLLSFAQAEVRFVNAGAMYVADNSGTTMYVPDAFQAIEQSAIVQQGVSAFGGSFYQDSDGNAFAVDASGRNSASGTIKFVDTNASGSRSITATGISSFDRSAHYAAFPNLDIATSDQILVPEKMGLDATSISSSSSGRLVLQSNPSSDDIYSASLRINGGTVASDAVTVERYMASYRGLPRVGFAPAYTNLRNGYFLGDNVREFRTNDNNGNVINVYAQDKDKSGNYIFMLNPDLSYRAGEAYMIALPNDYGTAMASMSAQYSHDPADYLRDKYTFDGAPTPWNQSLSGEQLFSGNIVREVKTTGKDANWVIGNSFSAPIDLEKLKDAIFASDLNFYSKIYVLPPQSTSYIPIEINPANESIDLTKTKVIPQGEIFLLQVSKSTTKTGQFVINNSMLVHDKKAENFRASNAHDEVLFSVSAQGSILYDMAAVGLRSKAKAGSDNIDMKKSMGSEHFQLYFPNVSGDKLSSNALPFGTRSATMNFVPDKNFRQFNLKATRLESLSTDGVNGEGLWLEDKQSNQIIDLLGNGGEYAFQAEANDAEERFVVHFFRSGEWDNQGGTTGIDDHQQINESTNPLSAYYAKGELIIKGISEQDLGTAVVIYDMQGRKLMQSSINESPQMHIAIHLTDGIYLAKIKNVTLKFKK